MTQPFRLRNAVLLAALAAVYPVLARGAAARVDFATAGVTAQGADGSRRVLAKGSEVAPGDTVLTNAGHAQMRFTDGAMVALKPGSEFRIDDYKYNGKPDGEERGFFSLLKGGLRTITGLVGRSDRSKYRINTVVATIGIRGTEFSVTYGNSINVHTAEGIVEVCNSTGCLLLYPGDEGYVKQETAPPVLVQTGQERPSKDDTPPELSEIEAPANERNANGEIALVKEAVTPTLAGTQNYGVLWGHVTSATAVAGSTSNNSAGTIDANGALTGFGGTNFNANAQPVSSLGNDGIVAWGHWVDSGSSGLTANGSAADGVLHYAAGLPTLDAPAVLPNATYALLGGSVSGNVNGMGSVTGGSLNVSFSTATINSLLINMSLPTSGAYLLSRSGATIGTLANGGLGFSGGTGSVTGAACSSGCSAGSVNGAFFGSGASRAGVSFSFTDGSFQAIAGTAAFTR